MLVPLPVCRLDDEITAKKELEKEIAALKDTIEDTKVNHAQIQKEIDLLKEELTRLENEHKDVRLDTNAPQERITKLHFGKSNENLPLL